MQHVECFDAFLANKVNLGKFKLDLLSGRVETIYKVLKADPQIGPFIVGKTAQGSWAHRTIINPLGNKEFDADFMLHIDEHPEWSVSPKTYIEQVYGALHRNSVYKDMPHSKKCRCVQVGYANSMHVDIVPFLELSDGRSVIVNRDNDMWEDANPQGFTDWMKEKDDLAHGNLRKVIRLLKYLRDHKNSFTGTRSIILTTLLGERVNSINKIMNPGYYGNLPTALLHIVSDLDEWLQARPLKPSIADPSNSGSTFDHRWEQHTYSYFRERIHVHAAEIAEAFYETDKDRSLKLWQSVFGNGFVLTAPVASDYKFPSVVPAAAATTVGRSGRAG